MAVVLFFYQDSFSPIAYWGKVKKKRKRKLRYQIHECSTQKHSCILNHLLWVKVLSTKCMKRLLRQQIYLHTFVHVNSSEVNTHMQTYSPQCTIHWVAIFVHTSRASLLTTLFGKFCTRTRTHTQHFTKTMFSLQVFLAEDKWQYYGILKWGDGRLKGLLKDICLIALSNLDFLCSLEHEKKTKKNQKQNWWSHLTLRAKMSNVASQNLVSNPLLANDPPPPTLTGLTVSRHTWAR